MLSANYLQFGVSELNYLFNFVRLAFGCESSRYINMGTKFLYAIYESNDQKKKKKKRENRKQK